MTAEIIPFRFHTREVRVSPTEDGLSFKVVLKDVASALGYGRTRDAAKHVPEQHKGAIICRTPGGDQSLLAVYEAGLYRLILRSRKPEAEPFIEWVTADVLPTIRRTGGYSQKQAVPQFIALSNASLKLIDRLKRETASDIRQMLYQQLHDVCQQLRCNTPPLEAIGSEAPPVPDERARQG